MRRIMCKREVLLFLFLGILVILPTAIFLNIPCFRNSDVPLEHLLWLTIIVFSIIALVTGIPFPQFTPFEMYLGGYMTYRIMRSMIATPINPAGTAHLLLIMLLYFVLRMITARIPATRLGLTLFLMLSVSLLLDVVTYLCQDGSWEDRFRMLFTPNSSAYAIVLAGKCCGVFMLSEYFRHFMKTWHIRVPAGLLLASGIALIFFRKVVQAVLDYSLRLDGTCLANAAVLFAGKK